MYKEEILLEIKAVEHQITAERLGLKSNSITSTARQQGPSSSRDKSKITQLQRKHHKLSKDMANAKNAPENWKPSGKAPPKEGQKNSVLPKEEAPEAKPKATKKTEPKKKKKNILGF